MLLAAEPRFNTSILDWRAMGQPQPPADLSADPPSGCDIAVVGAGIVGLAAARELAHRHPDAAVAVLEREQRIAVHQTGHSSGVIHAGIYYRPGSLKARLCVAGARELYEYCDERGIRAERPGKVIVATELDELPRLDELQRRAIENGVPGVRRIGSDELREIEPHAQGFAALHSPSTGVVDFREVTASLGAELTATGGTISTGCGVRAIDAGETGIALRHPRGGVLRRRVVGSPRCDGRSPRRPADRPLPWRLPATAARAPGTRPHQHLSRSGPRSALPRGPPHARPRRLDPRRAVGPDRRGARRIPADPGAPARARRDARLARDVAPRAAPLAQRRGRAAPRAQPPRVRG